MCTTSRLKQCLTLLVFEAQIFFTIFLVGSNVKSRLFGTVVSGQTLAAIFNYKMKLINLTFILILLLSCDSHTDFVKYKDGKQLLTVNDIKKNGDKILDLKVKVISPDTVKSGDPFLAKVFLSDSSFKIVKAVFDCPITQESLVDTSKIQIVGCHRGLMVVNDTVKIYFTVGVKTGLRDFPIVTILSVDNEKVYRYHQGTFTYYVVPN
jgi:hypothetical protein